MQEWTVVGVVVVLVGLIGSVSSPLIKLNSNITKLTVAVDNFQRALDKLEGENRESHKNFYNRLDCHDKELAQHEQRIKALEEE